MILFNNIDFHENKLPGLIIQLGNFTFYDTFRKFYELTDKSEFHLKGCKVF